MNIKKKLSMLLVLSVVMGGHAHQDMNVTQAPVAVPQEEGAVAVQTQSRVQASKKSKKQARKQPSKKWKMSARGKHSLKRVGKVVSVIVGTVAIVQIFGWCLWMWASTLI